MAAHVLICDDEFPIANAVGMKLTKCGFTVETRSDGLAAWESYCEMRPDLLVTDLQMPRLDGLSLIRRIRQQDVQLPIILLTAKGFEIDEADMNAEFGRFRLFAKPFSPRELANVVGEMVQDSAVEDAEACGSAAW